MTCTTHGHLAIADHVAKDPIAAGAAERLAHRHSFIYISGPNQRLCRPLSLQELQNDSGGDVSSDGGSPTAARDSGDSAAAAADDANMQQRISGSGGGLTKRISGRFSQEAFAAKEQELSFLQQRCMQFEVCS